MMTNSTLLELKQKYLFERRDFFLNSKGIKLFVKDLEGETEKFIQYETITPNTRLITRQDGRIFTAAISFGFFTLVSIVLGVVGITSLSKWSPLWAVAAVIFFGFHLLKRRRYFLVELRDRTSVFFLANTASKEKLKDFMHSLYSMRKQYLREKYFIFNPDNELESEISKMNFLLEEGVISESEFQEMKEKITALKVVTEL